MKKNLGVMAFSLSALIIFGMTPAYAMNGPVILGGDDQGEHGSGDGTTNSLGWLYTEKAIENLLMFETSPGPNTVDVLAIGSADPGAGNYPTFNAGGMMNSVKDVLGITVQWCDGTGAGPGTVDTCLADLASGTIKPRVVWLAGSDTGNDLDPAEGLVLTANAATINNFVASGGGLMSHGFGDVAYGWLNVLLPGINDVSSCQSNGATLTPAGMAAFPMLTNADISSGPCHNHFTGDFGNLEILGNDGQGRAFIIGLAAGTISGGGIVGGGDAIAGEILPIDTTALLIAGAQSSSLLSISVLCLIGAIGIGSFYYKKRRN